MTRQIAQVGMAVNDQVWPVAIKHDPELTVAQHPVLREWLAAKRTHRRREVHQRDRHVRVEAGKRVVQRLCFAPRAQGKALERSSMDGIRASIGQNPPPLPVIPARPTLTPEPVVR